MNKGKGVEFRLCNFRHGRYDPSRGQKEYFLIIILHRESLVHRAKISLCRRPDVHIFSSPVRAFFTLKTIGVLVHPPSRFVHYTRGFFPDTRLMLQKSSCSLCVYARIVQSVFRRPSGILYITPSLAILKPPSRTPTHSYALISLSLRLHHLPHQS